jgi:RimJ/RimL family protein N-acetyltransferase
MAWTMTSSLDEFLDAAAGHLRAEPVRNTVLLTVLESLRHSGLAAYSDSPPVFGWHVAGAGAAGPGAVDGAFLQTPPHPVLLARLPEGSAGTLIDVLTTDGRRPQAANLVGSDQAEFTAAWASATGGTTTERQRSRLFRLAGLVPPDPAPRGAARLGREEDRALLVRWHADFAAEATEAVINPDRIVSDRLSHDGLMLWETDGQPVAMAGLTRAVAGVTRVASVYTPPALRRRGYGGAITAAVTQAALTAGAAEVVLFTDVANPTSNALYQRLGYRPIEDRVLLALASEARSQRDVTAAAPRQGAP